MYVVIPTLNEKAHDAEVMAVACATFTEALKLADALTDDMGESFSVLQVLCKTEPPEPEYELEDVGKVCGLTAGVDYPFTLFKT